MQTPGIVAAFLISDAGEVILSDGGIGGEIECVISLTCDTAWEAVGEAASSCPGPMSDGLVAVLLLVSLFKLRDMDLDAWLARHAAISTKSS